MNELYEVNGKILDEEQSRVIESNSKHILVVAGAGTGKSTTIIGKIHYLLKNNNVKENEILCISFTNESCNSLKEKLYNYYGYNIEVLTFHKLSLKILKDLNIKYNICSNDSLRYLIDEYFSGIIYGEDTFMLLVIKYFRLFVFDNIINSYKKITNNKINELKNNIYNFISLFKTNGFNHEYLINMIKIEENKKILIIKRKLYFLYLVIRILYEYELELMSENKIDFDDMIVIADNLIKSCFVNYNYKYIIVDEFQDTSVLRYNLINSLVEKCNSNFIVVGDDYQSIYGFSGCDLSLFLNLNKSDFETIKIQNTYRNSNELVKVASNFVSKNKLLIKKNLKSNKKLLKPIKIIYYNNEKEDFNKLIDYLCNLGLLNLLILGRNNNDIYNVINYNFEYDSGKLKYKNNKDACIKYLTVHKSKGLESENVIIISLFNGKYGFPCKINNNKLLESVMIGSQYNSYEEERRLFYVALTRTLNYVYLFTSKNKPSMFVNELLIYENDSVEIIDLT